MSKESYARGFCKAAEAAGVDPLMLVKLSQAGIMRDGPTVANANWYNTLHGAMRPNSPYSTTSEPKPVARMRPIDALRGSGIKPAGGGFLKPIISRLLGKDIKSFKFYDPERSRISAGPWGRLFNTANRK